MLQGQARDSARELGDRKHRLFVPIVRQVGRNGGNGGAGNGAGAGAGAGPHVKVFDAKTMAVVLSFFAFAACSSASVCGSGRS